MTASPDEIERVAMNLAQIIEDRQPEITVLEIAQLIQAALASRGKPLDGK